MGFLNRAEIRDKLVEHDLPLLRLLYFSFWFRLVFIGFIMLVICVPLCVLKLWRTSPPNVDPLVKVSGIDLLQVWSLKRAALKAQNEGRIDDAIHAWRNAIANNLADVGAVRSLIAYLADEDESMTHWRAGATQAFWLLRLTQTNRNDLELTTRLFSQYGLNRYTISLLESQEDNLSPALEVHYLKALFDEDYSVQFGGRLAELGENIKPDPDLNLYIDAYESGWGMPPESIAAHKRLLDALADPDKGLLAHRLQLKVMARLGDLAGYESSLAFLKERHEAEGRQHITYWRLLAAHGQKQRAVELAESYQAAPGSGLDALRFADVYSELGLNDLANEYLQHYTREFVYAPSIWDARARLLESNEEWRQLEALALEIRNNPRIRDALYSHSFYLEGRAKLGLDRPLEAKAAFERINETQYQNPRLALYVGANLTKLGYYSVARDLLIQFRDEFEGSYAFWNLIHIVSNRTKDDDLLLLATENIYRIRPASWVAKSNYAACLIALRQDPAEAIKLTFELLSERPDLRFLKINHALALVVNHRFEEASELLDGMDLNGLSDTESAGLYLVMFEVNLHRDNIPEAVRISSRIDRDVLFPSERNWLEAKLKQVRARL